MSDPDPGARRTAPDAPPRDFVAVAPAERETHDRATVRVLVVDDDGRVLLFRDSDPNTGDTWWFTPGGGIDAGERELDAVVRELAEETGQTFAEADVLGPLARRHVVHGYSDRIVEQDDVFYAVRRAAFDVVTDGYTAEEQVTMLAARWWTTAELAASTEPVWPAQLPALLTAVDEPDTWPVPLADAEESSVPV
jgi:8-oxo-dGTP pyrophosphatase MutT (NUDIX family)